MDYSLIIKPEAEKDIDQAVEWYQDQDKNLISQLLNEFENGFNKILDNPKHFQKRYHEIRIIFTKKFPYGIYYTLEEGKIYVHAVLHNKQNPKNISKRLK